MDDKFIIPREAFRTGSNANEMEAMDLAIACARVGVDPAHARFETPAEWANRIGLLGLPSGSYLVNIEARERLKMQWIREPNHWDRFFGTVRLPGPAPTIRARKIEIEAACTAAVRDAVEAHVMVDRGDADEAAAFFVCPTNELPLTRSQLEALTWVEVGDVGSVGFFTSDPDGSREEECQRLTVDLRELADDLLAWASASGGIGFAPLSERIERARHMRELADRLESLGDA